MTSVLQRKNKMAEQFFLFLFFFILGIAGTVFAWKLHWYEELLSVDDLAATMEMQWNYRTLLVQCLLKRGGTILFYILISHTILGIPIFRMMTAWYSLSIGILMEALALQYGVWGIGVFTAGILPHYLFYIPAYLLVYRGCLRTRIEGGKGVLLFLTAFGVVIIGSITESYVNPFLLKNFLKLFIT